MSNTNIVAFQPAVENYGSRSLTAADVRAHARTCRLREMAGDEFDGRREAA